MGGEQDVVELEQRIVRGDGLRVQGIEAGGLDVALGQGMRESVLIDDTPRSMLTKYAVGFAQQCGQVDSLGAGLDAGSPIRPPS